MDEKLKSFIDSMGVLCEVWTLTYTNFVNQGLKPSEAMKHTQGFMSTFIATITQTGGQ